MSAVRVRLWSQDRPSSDQPYHLILPAVPREGDLVRLPWAAARRVQIVSWDIDPQRDPPLIADVYV